jgi:hypothetical protein
MLVTCFRSHLCSVRQPHALFAVDMYGDEATSEDGCFSDIGQMAAFSAKRTKLTAARTTLESIASLIELHVSASCSFKRARSARVACWSHCALSRRTHIAYIAFTCATRAFLLRSAQVFSHG